MTDQSSIPAQAQNARTVPQMLSAVNLLADSDTVRAIPHLARIDRISPGWLTAILIGGIRICVGLIILAAILLVSLWLVVILNQGVTEFIQSSWSEIWSLDIESADFPIVRNEIISSPVTSRFISFFWLAMLVVDGIILFRSKGMRSAIKEHSFWPESEPLSRPLRTPLQVIEKVSQGTALIFVGFFVALSLLPMGLLILEFIKIIYGWLGQEGLILDTLSKYWRLILMACIIVGVACYFLRERGGKNFDRLILILFGALACTNLIAIAELYGVSTEMIAILLVLSFAYPVGIAVPVSRFSFWPFGIIRNGLYWAYQRVKLRWRTAVGIKHHHQRNMGILKNDVWATVCREHLIRFVPRSEKISYFRRVRFGLCPECENDLGVFNGVECLALLFEINMPARVNQISSTLYLNGLKLDEGSEQEDIPVFDTIVVRQVNDHDIEAFITKYENKAKPPEHKSLRQLPIRIAKDSNLAVNEINLLKSKTGKVIVDYDDQIDPNPCVGNLRMKETVEKGALRFRQVTVKLAKIALGVIIIFGIAIGSIYLVEEYNSEDVEWASDSIQFLEDLLERYTQNR